jgi:hypothetical protein
MESLNWNMGNDMLSISEEILFQLQLTVVEYKEFDYYYRTRIKKFGKKVLSIVKRAWN